MHSLGRAFVVFAALVGAAFLSALWGASPSVGAAESAVVDFSRDIAPLLKEKCLRCHDAEKQDGDLDMSSRAAMLQGGSSGPAFVPGNVEKSLMLELIEFDEMPPRKEKPRVTKEEFEKLSQWVAAGAPGPQPPSEDAVKTTSETADAAIAEVVQGNNRFALDLYQRLAAAEESNLFFSPTSLSTALAMTYAGAREETEQQMAEVLHFALPQNRLHPTFHALNAAIVGAEEKDYQLRIANRLWGQQGYGFLPEFLAVTRQHYDAELAQVDFVQQAEAARQQINAWVEEQTEQRIADLIPPGVLDSLSRLVLTNAIYFKGQWTSPFDERMTEEAPFHLASGETVDVPLMHQKSEFKYVEADGLQIVRLPYGEDQELSMVVLLPKPSAPLAALEETLTAEQLTQWTAGLESKEVQVYLPRFQMTSQFQLKETLQSMGMVQAFVPDEADFSGMNGRRDLYISAAIHKAFVEVNEEGTEAAAATGIAIGVTSLPLDPPPVFRADRPFLFLIQHDSTGSLLFMGRVMNPQP